MFDQGSVEPIVGEVLTGATSGHYGTITRVEVESGSWAAGTADGRIEMSGVSGLNEDRAGFQNNEILTTPLGGTLVADKQGWEQVYGILYPDMDMRQGTDGHWYCKWHYELKFGGGEDEAKIDISEKDRVLP